jgi:uncharacterized membrane protein
MMAETQVTVSVVPQYVEYGLCTTYTGLFCAIFLNPRHHRDVEKLAKELLGFFAVIIIGVAILAVWWYVYELTQRSIVTWAVGVLLAFAVMHIGKRWSYS